MSATYNLEKWVWTEADFEIMGWHDSQIHAMAFCSEDFELVLDIDYILKWIHPQPGEIYFSFWVAPATLVFENIYDLELNLSPCRGFIEIEGIERTALVFESIDKRDYYSWTIACQEGEIKFNASGYNQYFRADPTYGGQRLDRKSIGYSFDRHKTD
jgi:hypothetical protein